MTFDRALIAVWQQALVNSASMIELAGERFPVRFTSRQKLRQVDFTFRGESLRGLEQNPHTTSRWAARARSGAKVMQFLSHGRYVAVVVDGKVTMYERLGERSRKQS